MKIAAIAAALVCLVSFVTAAEEHATMDVGMTSDPATNPGLRGTSLDVPVGAITNTVDATNNKVFLNKSNVLLSKSDRVQLVKIIKEKLATHPEEVDPAAANFVLEQLEQLEPDNGNTSGTTANVATNPAVISNVINSILSAVRRNPAAATGYAVGAATAAIPAVMAPPTPVATRFNVNRPTMRQIPMSSTAMGSAAGNSPSS
ncbi:uncharacterized protein IUM83_13447 [Phytophthora cinnamomi]|uniref:uncharacterized protein n=1 Tax=Phytophthora cinnamomi TaxID=4785 RepID=UPI0035593E2C|nr:hypothetical protein IUM83_13447 [Phytophthora cinnamomi]